MIVKLIISFNIRKFKKKLNLLISSATALSFAEVRLTRTTFNPAAASYNGEGKGS
jgi:hypothetical protein